MIQEKYNELPDGMDPVAVQLAFDELFAEAKRDSTLDVLDILEALYQLADRQWHTYSILPAEQKMRLELWIGDHWMPTSLDFIVKVGFIAGCVGLPSVFSLLQAEARNNQLPNEVRNEIVGIVKELTPRIDDPYQGIPK